MVGVDPHRGAARLAEATCGLAELGDGMVTAVVDAPARGVVRLLPRYDTYVLGYRRSRSGILPEEHEKAVRPGGGFIRPTIAVDGRIVGTWPMRQRRGTIEVSPAPFGGLSAGERAGLAAELEDIRRFTGHPVEVVDGSGVEEA